MQLETENKKLKDISDISLGYSFRGRVEDDNDGNIFVIQARDIKNNSIISSFDDLFKIQHLDYKERLLQKGDILLSNRGYFRASLFDLEKNTIATSSIYILRVKKNIILSEYLAIWVNSQKGQNQISRNLTGSMIKTILKSELENIKVEIPSTEEQKKIIELNKIKTELKNKLKEKENIIENIFQGALSKTINK